MLVSIVSARAIAAELKSRRIDPGPVLTDAGIPPASLRDSREFVALPALRRLVEQSLRVTQDPALGLYTGAHTPLLMTHILGPLMLSCATLREAIREFQRFGTLLASGVNWAFSEGKSRSFVRVDLGVRDPDTARFFEEFIAAMMFRVGAAFCERGIEQDIEVSFRHETPTYVAAYEKVFKQGVKFAADATRIGFPSALLDRVQPHADGILCAMFRDSAERLLRERDGKSIADKVRMTLRFGSQLRTADVKSIALAVGISPRALRRKLKFEGASATALLEEERIRLARERLRDPGRTIKDIAESLGFSEPSAFHRAFKRWTGMTPSKFAKAERRGGPPVTGAEERDTEERDTDERDAGERDTGCELL